MRMRALRIDFKGRPKITLPGAILLLAGITATAFVADRYQWAVNQEQSMQHRLDLTNRRSGALPQAPEELPSTADLPYMQEVLRRLNLPWDGLFSVLEKTIREEVALVSLKPEAGLGVVRIGGEARDLYAMLAYAQQLQETKYFGEIALASHEIDPKGGDKSVRFQLVAKWRP